MHISLQARVTALIALTVTLIVVGKGVVDLQLEATEREAEAAARYTSITTMQAEALARPLWDFNEEQINDILRSLARDSDFLHATVRGTDNKVVAERAARPPVGPAGETAVSPAAAKADLWPFAAAVKLTAANHAEIVGTLNVVFTRHGLRAAWRRQIMFSVVETLVVALVTSMGATAAFRLITRPLRSLTSTVIRMADGDLAVEVEGAGRHDELGNMANAMVVLRDRAVEARRLRQLAETEERRQLEAASSLAEAALAFERSSAGQIVHVEEGEVTLKRTAQLLDTASADTALKTACAAQGVADAVSNVAVLAVAVARAAGTVNEVSERVAMAVVTVGGATQEATAALAHIAALSEVTGYISAIVTVIRDIASRTSLLALNASIEAARAGPAGKGFAVVAQEVKALAGQTAHATIEVSRHIAAIKLATTRATDGIGLLSAQVGQAARSAASVAVAVEQQRLATVEIAAVARSASLEAERAAARVAEAAANTQQARHVAASLPKLAEGIANATESLRFEIGRFLGGLKKSA